LLYGLRQRQSLGLELAIKSLDVFFVSLKWQLRGRVVKGQLSVDVKPVRRIFVRVSLFCVKVIELINRDGLWVWLEHRRRMQLLNELVWEMLDFILYFDSLLGHD
jgi:hypothetical protein